MATPLTATEIDTAARLLAEARQNNRVLDALPAECRPQRLTCAYAIQSRLIQLLGATEGGWFCACTNVTIQEMLGLREPYYARLLSHQLFPAPARLSARDYPPMVLECEFSFLLGADLPARDQAYTRDEVEAAIATVHPSIEVVAGYLRDWPQQEVYSLIADNGTDGALVYGPGLGDWQHLDLINTPVTLSLNGELVRRGCGANVLGDPLEALVWLANARARDGEGLRAGQFHNTGTATEIIWVKPGDVAQAEFAGLGVVDLEILP